MKKEEPDIRAFIAIDLPENIIAALKELLIGLKGRVPGIRWVSSERIHLTLKFLGDIKREDVEPIGGVLQNACSGQPPMNLAVAEPGAFPGIKHPRVIWLGVDGDIEGLLALRKEIETGCASLGYPEDNRSFAPHLTLGRVRDAGKLKVDLAERLKPAKMTCFKPFSVSELHLYRSELRPDGAVYTKLKSFPLGGKNNRR